MADGRSEGSNMSSGGDCEGHSGGSGGGIGGNSSSDSSRAAGNKAKKKSKAMMGGNAKALAPVVVQCSDLLTFHEDLLMTKFGPGLDEVTTHLNFVVQLLNVVYCALVDITNGPDELNPAKRQARAMATMINNFTRFFPRCIDYEFLKAFCKSAREKVPKLSEGYLSLQELAEKTPALSNRLPKVFHILGAVPAAIGRLEKANENASILTKKLFALKQEISKPLHHVMEDVHTFRTRTSKTEKANHVELQSTIDTCVKKYQKLVSEPPLKRAVQIQYDLQQTFSGINAQLKPFVKLSKDILSKNAHFSGAKSLDTEDAETIEKYIRVFASPSEQLYESMLSNPEDFIQAVVLLTVALEKDLFYVDKRHYSLTQFDSELFQAQVKDYQASATSMKELEADSGYVEKLSQRVQLDSLYDEASRQYEDSLHSQRANLALYHGIVKSFKALRHHVAECCYRDFHQRVELAAPL